MALLEVDDLVVRFDGIAALDGATLRAAEGEVVGLIGPNGAGKTTLFNCLTRLYEPTSGSIRYEGSDLLAVRPHEIAAHGIARTFQNLALFGTMSVRENVMVGAHHRGRAGFTTAGLRLPAVRADERGLRRDADDVLARLDLLDVADQPAAGLPYGTQKRVELARALAGRPRLLLLDEPANGLSHSEVDALAELVSSIRGDLSLTMVVVEHHMGFVMRLSDRVACLELGRTIAEGTPEQVQCDSAVRAAYLGPAA